MSPRPQRSHAVQQLISTLMAKLRSLLLGIRRSFPRSQFQWPVPAWLFLRMRAVPIQPRDTRPREPRN